MGIDDLVDFEPRKDRNMDTLAIKRTRKEVRITATESIDDFLRRGGTIKRVAAGTAKDPVPLVPSIQLYPTMAPDFES